MINAIKFNHYLTLLNHPNERQRTDALQDLFFELLHGQLLHPDQWERLIPVLISNMSADKNETLRRWSYQVASFSINNNQLLVDYCKMNIDKETVPENCSWMVAILSKNLENREVMKILDKKSVELTPNQILLASYLYSDSSEINPQKIIRSGDPLAMMWLASIGAYRNIAVFERKNPLVNDKDLAHLISETDNDEVLKHAMYALYLRGGFEMKNMPIKPFDYNKMGDQEKKWFFTLMWKDKQFVRENIDLFREILKEKHLFLGINEEVRIGIARGLADSQYLPELAPYIADWYSHETTPSSQHLLLKFMSQHQQLYQDFKEIVHYQKENGNDTLKELVNIEADLTQRPMEINKDNHEKKIISYPDRTNTDIRIGIVTALTEEYTAMEQMLINPIDVIFKQSMLFPRNNGYRFTIGKIKSLDGQYHDVVLTQTLETGNESSLSRAACLMERFPNLEIVIMTGIAGGTPNPSDIEKHVRLGDIVVGTEIISYDYVSDRGKAKQLRKNNVPVSAKLLEAQHYLDSLAFKNIKPWEKYISEIPKDLVNVFSKPSIETDVLFDANNTIIKHPVDPNRNRFPKIYKGKIASANRVLKDPKKRDKLRDDYDVRAIEMESSGISSASWEYNFGYYVIRGISDYCDGKKNDIWHNYSALCAAAYTRSLIECIPYY